MQFVYMHVKYIAVFVKRRIFEKWCSYVNENFHIAGETWEIPQKLTMFNEFQLIVNFV